MSIDMQKATWPGWETVRLIGQGGFGAVHEIRRNLFGVTEKAALKVISIPQRASDIEEMYSDGYSKASITSTFQSHLESIVAEYSLMRQMNGSANIVNCDDVRYVQHDDGIGWDIFIKMELLTPLTKALSTDISEETVVKIAKDLCAALELCNKHGIIHRDIKPQNIFISPNGDYKLGDFGIAKTVEKTMGGTKIGTYKYMAPEVYNNQPYGHAADIYSLGLVLYWLLNERRLPFLPLPPANLGAGIDEQARSRRLSGEKLPFPAHGSEDLKRIVLKACAYHPKDRYQSAKDMLTALNALQFGKEAPVLKASLSATEPVAETHGEDTATVGLWEYKVDTNKTAGTEVIIEPAKDADAASRERGTDKEDRPASKPAASGKTKTVSSRKHMIVIATVSVIILCVMSSLFLMSNHNGTGKGERTYIVYLNSEKMDNRGHRTVYEYDEYGRLYKFADLADGEPIKYSYYIYDDGTLSEWIDTIMTASQQNISQSQKDEIRNKLDAALDYPEEKTHDYRIICLDKSGFPIRQMVINENISIDWDEHITYDSQGRRSKEIMYYPNYHITAHSTYDDLGNKILRITYDSGTNTTSVSERTFDELGNMITKSKYSFTGTDESQTADKHFDEFFRYSYDSLGNLTVLGYFDGSRTLQYILENIYDAKGNITRRIYTYPQSDDVVIWQFDYVAVSVTEEEAKWLQTYYDDVIGFLLYNIPQAAGAYE